MSGMPAPSRSYLRTGTWVLHMGLALLGLWLLVAQPVRRGARIAA